VIDQLGGLQDTIKPMMDSLRKNELRPYEFIKDGHRSTNQPNLQNVKIMSASPFRASVKMEADESEHSEDGDREFDR
jgi:hypothetical protein